MHAASSLERLAEPGQDGTFANDPVVTAFRRVLNNDRNKDTRKCLLAIMPVAKGVTIQVSMQGTSLYCFTVYVDWHDYACASLSSWSSTLECLVPVMDGRLMRSCTLSNTANCSLVLDLCNKS